MPDIFKMNGLVWHFLSINFRILSIFLKKKKEKKKQAAAMGEHYLPSAKLYTDGHLFIQQCENL